MPVAPLLEAVDVQPQPPEPLLLSTPFPLLVSMVLGRGGGVVAAGGVVTAGGGGWGTAASTVSSLVLDVLAR